MTEQEFYEWLNDPENPEKMPAELLMDSEDKRELFGTVSVTEFGLVYRSGDYGG